jgi:hypothetical protein
MAPARASKVRGGTRDLTIHIDAGKPLAGTVRTTRGDVVPAFTPLVMERRGAMRDIVIARSIVDARGRFAVRVRDGDYDVVAAPSGWAPSPPTQATAGTTNVELVVSAGATIKGTVTSARDARPISFARVTRESFGGGRGASVQPSNAGTVTREDGSFELTGVPAGHVSLTVVAGEFNPKIESGLVAVDGETLGPITLVLTPLDGEGPKLELVGIGLALIADGDALRVDRVIEGGSAGEAGVVPGDRVSAIDGERDRRRPGHGARPRRRDRPDPRPRGHHGARRAVAQPAGRADDRPAQAGDVTDRYYEILGLVGGG